MHGGPPAGRPSWIYWTTAAWWAAAAKGAAWSAREPFGWTTRWSPTKRPRCPWHRAPWCRWASAGSSGWRAEGGAAAAVSSLPFPSPRCQAPVQVQILVGHRADDDGLHQG